MSLSDRFQKACAGLTAPEPDVRAALGGRRSRDGQSSAPTLLSYPVKQARVRALPAQGSKVLRALLQSWLLMLSRHPHSTILLAGAEVVPPLPGRRAKHPEPAARAWAVFSALRRPSSFIPTEASVPRNSWASFSRVNSSPALWRESQGES